MTSRSANGRGGVLRGRVVSKKVVSHKLQKSFCSYPHRVCMRNCLDGYDFCIRHILEDKTAPYKQCNYVFPRNGKRCPRATSKLERKDGYCLDHGRKSSFLRQKATRKRKPQETPETLLDELVEYSRKERSSENRSAENENNVTSFPNHLFPTQSNSNLSKLIDYASESESEHEQLILQQTWYGDEDSDAECVEPEKEDTLRHAGVYTAEEAALIARDKLIRLQALYFEQFKRLHHILKQKRRKYLHDIKAEKETLGNTQLHPKTPEEVTQYEKLKAFCKYQKVHGVELILHHRAKQRRKQVIEGDAFKCNVEQKCAAADKNQKCANVVVPYSKFCFEHILNDTGQVLFRPCLYKNTCCKEPIIPVTAEHACKIHTFLPPFTGLGGNEGQTNIQDQHVHFDFQDQDGILITGGIAQSSESETICSNEEADSRDMENISSYSQEAHGSNSSGRVYQIDPEVQHIQVCNQSFHLDIIRQNEREVFSKLPDLPPEDFLSVSQHSPETDVEK